MTTLTIEVPDHLAQRLRSHQAEVAEMIELGLRQYLPEQRDYYADVIDFLASGPA